MAYKITKYKGKTKIKDTKTGKSAEIDIEKFMNGGYKTISDYALGGESGLEADILSLPTNSLTSPISEEEDRNKYTQSVNSLNPEGLEIPDNLPTISSENSLNILADEMVIENDSFEKKNENDYMISNPYVGVDIPTAANHLGQSIENKDVMGIASSSLKMLTGLGRNVVTGLGQQNRYNQIMQDYYKKQNDNKNVDQYFQYGGKKEEELATGEYMHGVTNENNEEYNAEVEEGEYFQTNQGDIAEIVGKKHSKGGEKIQMEEEDRVLSDKLKLGSKSAKMLASKYDLNLKAKNTYSDVLDKFRKKMKLDKIIDEESEILKKIGSQDKVKDANTRNFNLQVLAQKKEEIEKQKDPIEELRKGIFEELFNIQEDSKNGKQDDKFEGGGKKKKNKEKDEELDKKDLQSINKSTGANFTLEGVNELFEVVEGETNAVADPELNLGKYDGLNYFNLNYDGNTFTVSPTKNNPGNAAKHREYLKYLQKQNPDFKLNTKANENGYLPFNQRLEYGGKLAELAKEYNIPLTRAKELVQEFSKGGKIVPKYQNGVQIGDIDPITGKLVTKELAEEKLASGEWEDLGRGRYVDRGTQASSTISQQTLKSYASTWDKNKFPNFEDYVSAAEKWKKENPDWNKNTVENTSGIPDQFFYTQEKPVSTLISNDIDPSEITTPTSSLMPIATKQNINGNIIESKDISEEEEQRNTNFAGAYLFPDETPLPPSALQGTLKIEPRYDRVRSSEINVEPYLQDIRDREESQVQSLEGLSPNVRAAVLANMRSNNQKAESDIRNQIDTQNLQSQEKAIYTNAQIQQREENSNNRERLMYEQRQYMAQAKTDSEINDYFNQLQAINKQRYTDVNNLNLINQANEDVAYIPGRGFVRKNSDKDLLRQIKV